MSREILRKKKDFYHEVHGEHEEKIIFFTTNYTNENELARITLTGSRD
jgi:hypothetical protein